MEKKTEDTKRFEIYYDIKKIIEEIEFLKNLRTKGMSTYIWKELEWTQLKLEEAQMWANEIKENPNAEYLDS